MMTATISFFVSFLGIIGMIVLKARRLRMETRSHFKFVSEKVDHKIRAVFASIRTFFGYFNRKSAVALVQWIAYHILSWIRSIYLWLHDKAHAHPPSKKVIDMVRGRGEIEETGGASFYLKNLAPVEEKKK
jgi:hypothetical protein